MNQGGNIERRDVGDSGVVSSKLSDMQNAIESLTHSVNNVATKQQVSFTLQKTFQFENGRPGPLSVALGDKCCFI